MNASEQSSADEERPPERRLALQWNESGAVLAPKDGAPLSERAQRAVSSIVRRINCGASFVDSSGKLFNVIKDKITADTLHELSGVLTSQTNELLTVEQVKGKEERDVDTRG